MKEQLYCPYCDTAMRADHRFCPTCGAQVMPSSRSIPVPPLKKPNSALRLVVNVISVVAALLVVLALILLGK